MNDAKEVYEEIVKDPRLKIGLEWYEMSRAQQMEKWWEIVSICKNNPKFVKHF